MDKDDLAKLRAYTEEREFADQIGFLLYWVTRRGQREVNDALTPLGVEVRHMRILGILAGTGARTQSQLIELLDIDKSSMVYLVDALEELGLAERKPAPGDRRAHLVHVTDAGRAKLDLAKDALQQVNARRYGVLSEGQRAQLHKILWRLIEADNDPNALTEILRRIPKSDKEST